MQVKTEFLESVLLEIIPGFHMWNVEGIAQALEMGPQQKVRRTKQGQNSCAELEQKTWKCILIQSMLSEAVDGINGVKKKKWTALFKLFYSALDHNIGPPLSIWLA